MKRGKTAFAAVAVLTALLCAALCFSVLSLYFGGVNRRAELQSASEPIFTREAVGRRLLWISPLLILWLASVIFARLRGAEEYRKMVPRGPLLGKRAVQKSQPETAARRLTRGALLLLAAALIVLGALNGGLNDVLVKAIHICTECIGLG